MGEFNDTANAISATNQQLTQNLQGSLLGSQPGLGPFPSGLNLEALGFEGPLVPGTNPLLEQAFQGAGQFGQGQLGQARNQALMQALSGQSVMQLDPALRAQQFEQNVARPETQRLMRQTLPGVNSRFLPGGQTGANARVVGQTLTDFSTNLAGLNLESQRADERFNAQLQTQALQRAQGAFGPSLAEELKGISVPAQLGGIQRAIQGQQQSGELTNLLLQQPFSDPRLPLFGALQGNPLLANSGGSGLGGILQLLGSLGQLGT